MTTILESTVFRRTRSVIEHRQLIMLLIGLGLGVVACSAGEEAPGSVTGSGGTAATTGSGGAATGGTTAGAGAGGIGMTGGAATGGAAASGGAGTGATGGTVTTGIGGAVAGGAAGTSGAGAAGGIGGGGSGGSGLGDPVETVEFLPNVRVNDNNNGNDVEVSIATGPDGLVLVSWVDGREGIRCGFDTSTDGGTTFGEDLVVRPESGGITGDAVAGVTADGTLMAVCQDYGISQIRLSTSVDGGNTWSNPRSIQGAPDKPWIGASPTESGVAFLTWLGSDAGINKTTDGGMTWDRVNDLESLNHGTTISVGSSGVVHIGYTPNGGPLRYVRSNDLGESWEPATTIAQTGTFCWGSCGSRQNPIIGGGADPTGQYVAFAWSAELPGGEGDEDIWIIYSSDFGDTWTEPIRANDNSSAARQWQPWVAVDTRGASTWSGLTNATTGRTPTTPECRIPTWASRRTFRSTTKAARYQATSSTTKASQSKAVTCWSSSPIRATETTTYMWPGRQEPRDDDVLATPVEEALFWSQRSIPGRLLWADAGACLWTWLQEPGAGTITRSSRNFRPRLPQPQVGKHPFS